MLQDNNHVSQERIAAQLGLSESTVSRILGYLRENDKYIRQEVAVVNADTFDLGELAFVQIDLKDVSNEKIKEVDNFIDKFPNVQEVHHLASDSGVDILVKIRAHQNRDVYAFIAALQATTNAIKETKTLLVMQTIKETHKIDLRDEYQRYM